LTFALDSEPERREATNLLEPASQARVSARRAFTFHREARAKHKLWLFYVEHNLFHEARNARTLMLEHLHSARAHWRAALGIA